MRSVGAPNWRAKVTPVELRLIHHSAAVFGRKIPMSVLLSPSKSNSARRIVVAEPPPQKPEIILNAPPVDDVPARDCPIVPSRVNVPPDARPPPPPITDFVIVNVPP